MLRRSDWRIKAALQKIISLLPAGHHIHFAFQKYVSRNLRLTDFTLQDRLDHVSRHLHAYRTRSGGELPEKVLEIGTGWYPLVPLGLYLCGAKSVTTVDLRPHFRPDLWYTMIRRLAEWDAEGRLEVALPEMDRQRWGEIKGFSLDGDLAGLLKRLPIRFCIGDATRLDLEAGSMDLIFSNNVFEHIPRRILLPILKENRRLLRPSGILSHYIDLTDHYFYSDPAIHPWHFLKYSPRQWSRIENRFQSQNRLRVGEYRSLFAEAGLQILSEENEAGDPEVLRLAILHPDFQDLPFDETLVRYSHIVAGLRR
jgi:hypothetical protein